ncbi:TIGR04086 family membrane protein [Amphibacillus sp. MSJ-3]|uniref:TIGR04086 family membrane protein n=1 Tax=Amphibacillus sp. MSJ-3 TaxID=2841505 RepID=UPI001C0F3098|nr:TIGR04086 family membrane protein [Amphibacillus sp. MSJ-3]
MKQRLEALMYGWLSIIILLIISSLALAILLRFTSLTNPLLDNLAIIAAFIILWLSGLISGLKAKQKGWMIGLTLSLSYSLIIYLYQYLGYNQQFTLKQILYHLGFLLVAVFGAVLGVNIGGGKQENS